MNFKYLNIALSFLIVSVNAQIDNLQQETLQEALINAQGQPCGTAEVDFVPCVEKERADSMFKQCCEQYAPEGCQSLCQYETDEMIARNLLLQAVKSEKCKLKHISTVLFCASQNQDNTQCCKHLNLSDSKLDVGDRCLRFCDPAGKNKIEEIAKQDVTCLFNWNVLMYCHHSGLKAE